MNCDYDVIVIGGGPGGYVGAIRASQSGGNVALIEKERIGGTCLNRGCIPTKTMIRSAEVFEEIREPEKYGLKVEDSVSPNFSKIMNRKDKTVYKVVKRVKKLLESHSIDVYKGTGTIVEQGLVEVKRESDSLKLSSGNIIIATGSKPAIPPIPGAKTPRVLTTRQLLNLTDLPESLIVVGGSTIGLEFASLFNVLGSSVTVLGRKTFLKDADERIARRFRAMIGKRGVDIKIGIDFKKIVARGRKLQVIFERKGKEEIVEGERVLLATGRRPYTHGLGLDNVGIETERGAIVTDKCLETNVSGIYAVGDVLGSHMMAHVASYQGEVAAENAMGQNRTVGDSTVPICIFTFPEIASAGVTYQEAREKGLDFEVAQFPFSANGRAIAMGQEEGQVILIYERDSGKVLGVHIMGAHASDLIGEGIVAIQQGATVKDLANTIHPHPTFPETVMEAAKAAAFGEAIHFRKI